MATLVFVWSRLSDPPPAPTPTPARVGGASTPTITPPVVGLTLFDFAEALARIADLVCPAADLPALSDYLDDAGEGDDSFFLAPPPTGNDGTPKDKRVEAEEEGQQHPLIQFWKRGGSADTVITAAVGAAAGGNGGAASGRLDLLSRSTSAAAAKAPADAMSRSLSRSLSVAASRKGASSFTASSAGLDRLAERYNA